MQLKAYFAGTLPSLSQFIMLKLHSKKMLKLLQLYVPYKSIIGIVYTIVSSHSYEGRKELLISCTPRDLLVDQDATDDDVLAGVSWQL